ncbi:type III secretion system gatekeeper subunit SctW [Rugamonas aquatica]|uniref:YopN family type III secretion system gatekeeper subunit n=1 Tax=Rugamonas aquatica TaxID=2743357 RepID=A0A6A7N6I4_9BURK|nr:type III secretion system gatekeeper subunit SctW [Rugamonas aquatica]MQA40703.1 YopN family type III secretion system gatekeeper subunit [Rugamonas aquatica]
MYTPISSNASALQTEQPDASAPAQGPQTGVWRGETITVEQSDGLGNAAEEISFAHESTEPHKLHERKISKRRVLALPPPEAIDHYLQAVGKREQRDKFKQFVDTLKSRGHRNGQRGGARQLAHEQFAGVTEQFLALAYAANTLTREGGHSAVLTDVREAFEDLHRDAGSHIDADLNTVGVASEFGAGNAAAIANFQDGYRDAVLGEANLCGLLRGALERFGVADYRSAINSLIRALDADLDAIEGCSVDPIRLHTVLQELYLLRVLATGLDDCQSLAGRLLAKYKVTLEPGALLQDVVAASVENWVDDQRFPGIADQHATRDYPPRIMLLTGTLKLVKQILPEKIFLNRDARHNIIAAAQEALDSAIAEESLDPVITTEAQ